MTTSCALFPIKENKVPLGLPAICAPTIAASDLQSQRGGSHRIVDIFRDAMYHCPSSATGRSGVMFAEAWPASSEAGI
jgi:hypothetical protein